MTDQMVTDATFASRSGLYDFDGNAVRELAGPALGKLPSVVPSDTVVGQLKPVPGAELGLRPGIPVVIGAGDRQCEVLGSGASEDHPMVSWGTTGQRVGAGARAPRALAGRRRGDPRRRTAAGCSRAASPPPAPSWPGWGRCSTARPTSWARLAGESPPGARGVVAVPWLDGARAPWWRDDARAGFMGLGAAHGAADLARAVVESVAWDVLRVHGGGHGRAPRRLHRGGRDAGRRRLGAAGVGRGPHVRARRAGAAPPLGRGRLGRRGVAGRQGARHGAHPRPARSRRSRDRAGPRPPSSSTARLRPRVDHVAEAVLAATESLPGIRPTAHADRARPAGLRPTRDDRSRCPRAPRSSCPLDEPGLDDEAAAITAALRHPLAGPPLGELAGGRRAGGRRVPRPDPAHAQPHRAATAAGRAGACRRARRCASRSCAPPGRTARPRAAEMAELVGRRHRGPLRRGRPRRRRATRTCQVGEVDGTPVLLAARVRARPTSASSPASSSPTSSPASAAAPRRSARDWPPPRRSSRRTIPAASPMPRATFVTRHRQPGARLRPGRRRAGAARTCRSTSPSTGPAG